MSFKEKNTFLGAFLLVIATVACADLGEIRWDWSQINTDEITFDKSFMLGTAVSMYKVAGGDTSNWSACYNSKY